MFWTYELATKLENAPWPASKYELIDYVERSCSSMVLMENLQELEDNGEVYESIEDIWPEYSSIDPWLQYREEGEGLYENDGY